MTPSVAKSTIDAMAAYVESVWRNGNADGMAAASEALNLARDAAKRHTAALVSLSRTIGLAEALEHMRKIEDTTTETH